MFLEVNNIFKSYGKQEILKDVSFNISKGKSLGLIGGSGSGKSTLSRLILGLEKPNRGSVKIEGMDIKEWLKENKGEMNIVFQDYISSINPNFIVKDIIKEPLLAGGENSDIDEKVLSSLKRSGLDDPLIKKFSYRMNDEKLEEVGIEKAIMNGPFLVTGKNIDVNKKVSSLLKKVGLDDSLMERYPHELSDCQLQRVCIARAISTNPKFLVLDEVISSIDVSIQSQILDLLIKIQKDIEITYLFITRDLQIVTSICDNVVFLYNGQSAEKNNNKNLFKTKNNYVKKLINSVISFEKSVLNFKKLMKSNSNIRKRLTLSTKL